MYFSMGTRHDFRPALQNSEPPVLVIHGEDDLQSAAASRLYVDSFPNAEFKIIKNATHFPFNEQPQQFSNIVADFLGNDQ